MLILSRKQNQEIHIGTGIVVRVLQISGSRVSLAIDAPQSIPIQRGEMSAFLRDAFAADSATSKPQPDVNALRPTPIVRISREHHSSTPVLAPIAAMSGR
jgi:carbon storage regulator CsrA